MWPRIIAFLSVCPVIPLLCISLLRVETRASRTGFETRKFRSEYLTLRLRPMSGVMAAGRKIPIPFRDTSEHIPRVAILRSRTPLVAEKDGGRLGDPHVLRVSFHAQW